MSNSHAEDTVHTGPIKNPKQLLLTVAAAFIVPIFLIIGLVLYVATGFKPAGSNQAASMGLGGVTEQARERSQALRLQKVGMVEIRDANRPVRSGEEVYKAQCSACHASGVAGAPKFGDKAAWAPRITHGYDALLNSALHGKGAMSPQGGGDFSDVEIGHAVVYMANAGGGNLAEPKAGTPPAGGGETAQAAQTAQAAVPASPAAAAATVQQAKENTAATAQPSAATGSAAVHPATTLAATTPAAASTPAAPSSSAAPAAAERVAAVAPAPAAASGAGEALYKSTCFVCHAAGVAGAPKFGDKQAWAPRIATGMDTLVATAIKGIGAMPPRGGSTASDADMRAAVEYMVNAAK